MTEDQIKRILWRCIWMSRGSAPEQRDYDYWVSMWPGLVARGVEIHVPDYGERRVLGWQAEGADAARFGDYANPPSPYHAVPPYPGDDVNVTPPPPSVPPPDRFDALEAQIADLKGLILAIAQRPAPDYKGEGTIRYLGNVSFTLKPQ